MIEFLSMEGQTNSKVISLTNQKVHRQSSKPIRRKKEMCASELLWGLVVLPAPLALKPVVNAIQRINPVDS